MGCVKQIKQVKLDEPFMIQNRNATLYVPDTMADIILRVSADGVNYENMPDKAKVLGTPGPGDQIYLVQNIPHNLYIMVTGTGDGTIEVIL